MVPATTFANAPILIASYKASASLLLISPIIKAESPILNVVLMPSSAGTSLEPFDSAAATFIDWMLYPNFLNEPVGSSKVSSIVMTRYFLINSTSTAPSRLVFPALLVPAINNDLAPSIKKLIMPAANGFIILFCINKGSVHGLSRCLLKANANPVGFNGADTTATLAFAPGMLNSVSRIGFASSNGLPEISLSLDAHESASGVVGIMFVLQSA